MALAERVYPAAWVVVTVIVLSPLSANLPSGVGEMLTLGGPEMVIERVESAAWVDAAVNSAGIISEDRARRQVGTILLNRAKVPAVR